MAKHQHDDRLLVASESLVVGSPARALLVSHDMQRSSILMASRIVPEGGWSNLKPMRTPRKKNPRYLAFIRLMRCCICGRLDSEAAHIRSASLENGKSHTGLGQKPDDFWTLPLCRDHHSEQHRGN